MSAKCSQIGRGSFGLVWAASDLHDLPPGPCHSAEISPRFWQSGQPGRTFRRGDLRGTIRVSCGSAPTKRLIESTAKQRRYDAFSLTAAGEGTDVITICEDRSGYLWVGTYSHGLFRFDPRTALFKRFQHNPRDPHSLSNNIVPRLLVVHNGTLWAATHDGLDRFDAATGTFTTYRAGLQGVHPNYLELVEDRNGILWLGTESSGLLRFDPETGQFMIYQHDIERQGTLSNPRVNSVHFDRSGTMWIGTQEGLNRFDVTTGRFTTYSQREGLPGNVVGCVLEDPHGNLWMSTDNGVARFGIHKLKRHSGLTSTADGLPGIPYLTGWGTCFQECKRRNVFWGIQRRNRVLPRQSNG